mgnify:CR=1 FL=1
MSAYYLIKLSKFISRSPFFARLDALGLAYTYRGKEAPQ